MTLGIIGTGRMGRALASALAACGQPVALASARGSGEGDALTSPTDLLHRADALVLAVPFAAAIELLNSGLGQDGGGRVLIDVTNPAFGRSPGDPVPTHSAGETVAAAAPSWLVAKAFNTLSADMIDIGRCGRAWASVPVATDHAEARTRVFALVRALGYEPLDAGGISSSRDLESLAVLLACIGSRHGWGARIGIRIGARPSAPNTGVGWAA